MQKRILSTQSYKSRTENDIIINLKIQVLVNKTQTHAIILEPETDYTPVVTTKNVHYGQTYETWRLLRCLFPEYTICQTFLRPPSHYLWSNHIDIFDKFITRDIMNGLQNNALLNHYSLCMFMIMILYSKVLFVKERIMCKSLNCAQFVQLCSCQLCTKLCTHNYILPLSPTAIMKHQLNNEHCTSWLINMKHTSTHQMNDVSPSLFSKKAINILQLTSSPMNCSGSIKY